MYAQVLLQPHEQPPPPLGHCATAEEWGRTWPVEGARVWVFDVGGWRPWEQRDFDRYRVFTAAVDKRVWVSTSAPPPGNNLPAPAWPADAAAPPPVGAPPGCAGGVPGWLRGWERCGKWRGGPRHHRLTGELVHRGYPTVWGIPPVCPYAYDAFEPAWRILSGAAWETKALDTCASRRVSRRAGAAPYAHRLAAHNPPLPLHYLYRYVLMLCEDGSHGLDLSFVTHLFLINEVSDPAKRQQVVSRAHRMGATGPVVVEPVRMWDD